MSKLFSARFLLTIGIGSTFCWLALKGVVTAEAFGPIALIVIRDYFDRTDRQPKQGETK